MTYRMLLERLFQLEHVPLIAGGRDVIAEGVSREVIPRCLLKPVAPGLGEFGC